MVTKKLVKKEESAADISIEAQMLVEMRKQTEYLHRLDWKVWKLQSMLEMIAEENGYEFDIKENGIKFTDEGE